MSPDVHNKLLIKKAKDLFNEYYKDKDHKEYLGVELDELEYIEKYFNVDIKIYDLFVQDKDIVVERKRTTLKDENVVTLGLYENHFVYIKNLNSLTKTFRCM